MTEEYTKLLGQKEALTSLDVDTFFIGRIEWRGHSMPIGKYLKKIINPQIEEYEKVQFNKKG